VDRISEYLKALSNFFLRKPRDFEMINGEVRRKIEELEAALESLKRTQREIA